MSSRPALWAASYIVAGVVVTRTIDAIYPYGSLMTESAFSAGVTVLLWPITVMSLAFIGGLRFAGWLATNASRTTVVVLLASLALAWVYSRIFRE